MTNCLQSEVFLLVCIFTTEACKLSPKSGRSRGLVPGAYFGQKKEEETAGQAEVLFIFILEF